MAVPPSVSLADHEPGQCHGDNQKQPTLNSIDPTSGKIANRMIHRKPGLSQWRARRSDGDSGKVPIQACYMRYQLLLPRALQIEITPYLGVLIRFKETQETPFNNQVGSLGDTLRRMRAWSLRG